MSSSGVLYCGDNLEVLNEYLPPSSIDLVYLDPPFNSQRTYNIVYKDSRAQEAAFKDYWAWSESAETYEKLLRSGETPKPIRTMLRALHDLLIERDSDQLAYISMMTARLIALHRVLKPTGSLYLHCDPTASHYLKVVLDALFGSDNFQNEVIWQRFSSKNDPKRYGRGHDSLLFYTKSDSFCWNPQRNAVQDYSVDKNFTADDNGRRYTLVDLTAGKPGGDVDYEWHGARPYKGRFWAYSRENMDRMLADGLIVFRRTGMPRLKRYLDEQPGVPLQDVWTDIKLATASKERLGYPTQKPVALLERIIAASTNVGDIVLDPFCGCGTTIEACERMGRRWMGVDIASKAVEVIERRLVKLGLEKPSVTWHPVDAQAAHALAARPDGKKQFETWVLRKLSAVRRKKDRGIDGEAFFRDGDDSWHVIVSVKAGKLKPTDLRDLRGTIEREEASIGVLVCVDKPSKEMLLEAARAKFLPVSDEHGPIPRIQIVRVDDEFFRRHPIRVPGRNVTDMPRPDGEQMKLALNRAKPPVRASQRPPAVAVPKVRPAKPG